jgi:alpha-methylacyl-CoA racemase
VSGPLQGLRVVELAAIGPGPYCGMLLGDLGADVVRVERVRGGGELSEWHRVLNRGRRSIAVDLKRAAGVEVVLRLADGADALIEGFRPGVAERLGVGPEACWARNPRLVYGRITGWGQDGPLAHAAGHDINYIALTGALHAIGRAKGPPTPPLNLIEFGAGGLLLAFGVLCAVLSARTSGRGQIVDAAIVDGSASLLAMLCALRAAGRWSDERGTNVLDSGAPFYDVYPCADGKYVAVGALEEPFYRELLRGLGLVDDANLPDRGDPARWPELRARLAERFAARPRDDWTATFAGTDACVTPVLSLPEAAEHPHLRRRQTYVAADGIVQPAPAPRFSAGIPDRVRAQPAAGAHTRELLAELAYSDAEIGELYAAGAVG